MLASTSKSALRSVAPSARAYAFSTSAPRGLKKADKVVVELLEPVDGLGLKYDAVAVSVGRMRHELAPYRLARWIPWKRAGERVTATRRAVRGGPTEHAQIAAPGLGVDAAPAPQLAETAQAVLDALHALPPRLTFRLRTVSPTSRALHGSLTLSEVQGALAAHGLAGHAEVVWTDRHAGARMKELGTWPAVVRLTQGGREEAEIEIEAARVEA
ncbi:hypothetical protein Q5752_002008 [Cryptotrichosporon argae]